VVTHELLLPVVECREEDMARAVEEAHKGVEGEGLQVLMEVVFRYNEAVVRGHFIFPKKNADPNAHAEVDATLSEVRLWIPSNPVASLSDIFFPFIPQVTPPDLFIIMLICLNSD